MIVNSFTSYELTDKEALQSSVFTFLQLQNLQNQLAACAEEKLNLEFDTEHPNEFVQQEAYKRGQIELLKFLIDSSADAADQLNNPDFDDNL